MKIPRHLKNIDSFIAACIGFYLVYMYTSYSGVGLSPDSIMYASTATNIQAHGSLLTFNQTPLVLFPVFYPFFLGVIQFFSGVDPVKAGATIDMFLFGAVIFTSGWIISKFITDATVWSWADLRKHKIFRGWRILIVIAAILVLDYIAACFLNAKVPVIPDNFDWLGNFIFFKQNPFASYPWFLIIFRIEVAIAAVSSSYKRMILAAIIMSPGLLEVYTYLWSETLFILEVLFFFIAYRRYLQTHTLKSLLWAAIITAIACITRYVGITIIGTGGLMLLLDDQLPWTNWKKKIGHMLFYGGISISLLATNMILNAISTGLSTGTREPSVTPFVDNLHYFGTIIYDWSSLGSTTYPYAALVAAVILLAIIAMFLWKAFKGRINNYESIVIAFAIVYGLFIVIWASIQRFQQIDSRLMTPMFISLLIACTSWVPEALQLVRSKAKYVLAGLAVCLMLAFECATYQTDWQRSYDEDGYGIPGYADDGWNKSPFVIYLKAHKNIIKPGIPIYSDANEGVYLCTGLSSKLLPHRYFKNKVQQFYNLKRYYVVWFDSLYNPELIGIHDILMKKNLEKIGADSGGEIYYYDEGILTEDQKKYY